MTYIAHCLSRLLEIKDLISASNPDTHTFQELLKEYDLILFEDLYLTEPLNPKYELDGNLLPKWYQDLKADFIRSGPYTFKKSFDHADFVALASPLKHLVDDWGLIQPIENYKGKMHDPQLIYCHGFYSPWLPIGEEGLIVCRRYEASTRQLATDANRLIASHGNVVTCVSHKCWMPITEIDGKMLIPAVWGNAAYWDGFPKSASRPTHAVWEEVVGWMRANR